MSKEVGRSNDAKGRLMRMKLRLVSLTGYVLPLFASFPAMTVGWMGLMTLPFALFLVLMAGNLQESLVYFFTGTNALDSFTMVLGFLLFVYSAVFLRLKKSKGLVKEGPYRIVRHPQYVGLVLMTASMTSRSIWILSHTFGIGWFNAQMTLIIWYLMFFAYLGLATIEDSYLSRTYAEDWPEYRTRVGFMFPFVSSRKRLIDVTIPLLVFGVLMYCMALYSTWWV